MRKASEEDASVKDVRDVSGDREVEFVEFEKVGSKVLELEFTGKLSATVLVGCPSGQLTC